MTYSPARQACCKRYYEKHRERLLAACKQYQNEHREERLAYGAAYRVSHREERLAYQDAYYSAHREEMNAYSVAYNANVTNPRIADRRAFLDKAKAGVGCADCESAELLHFHHRDRATKKYEISQVLTKPWCDIMDEIFKCDVLCRSCHMKRHRAEDSLLVV